MQRIQAIVILGACSFLTAHVTAQTPQIQKQVQKKLQDEKKNQSMKVGAIIIVGYPNSDAAIRKALKLYPGQAFDGEAIRQAEKRLEPWNASISILDPETTAGFKDLLIKKKEQAVDKSAPATLEQMIQQALKNNPDIRVAEVKVREAQAERERTRLKVAADLGELLADIAAANAAQREGSDRYLRAKVLYEKKALSKEDLNGALLTFEKLEAEWAAKKAKLPYLMGKVAFEEKDAKGKTEGELTADALKNNPDILIAESKVQAAEAELNRIRIRVMADLAGLDAELHAARIQVKAAEASFERFKRLLAARAVSQEEYDAQITTLEKAKADLAVKEAKLPYLLGKQSAAADPNLGYYPPALALIQRGRSAVNTAAAVDEAIQKLWFQRFVDSGTVVTDEEFLRRAMLDLHGRVPTQEEMKSFLKMPEKDRRAKWIEEQKKMVRDSIWIDFGYPIPIISDGNPYLVPFASHVLDRSASLAARAVTPLTEKLRKALDVPVSLTHLKANPPELMKTVRDEMLGGDVNVTVRVKTWKKETVDVILPKKVPAGAMLQFLEDELDIVFVLRDYGVVVVAAEEKLPPGAVRVLDFWKYGKALEPAEGLKEKTLAPKGKPVPDGVRGVIEKVDPKDARLVQISIGSDAGLVQGQHLNLFRLQPEPLFLGSIRLVDVMSARSVARFVTESVDESLFPRVGDHVSSKLARK